MVIPGSSPAKGIMPKGKGAHTLPENKWTQQNHPATAAFLSMSTLKIAWVVLQVKAELKRMTSYI